LKKRGEEKPKEGEKREEKNANSELKKIKQVPSNLYRSDHFFPLLSNS